MVVYSATRAPQAPKEDALYALWSLIQDAREEPFDARRAESWLDAISAFAVQIDQTLRREGAPYGLTTACDRLIREIGEIEQASILDVIHVSELLIAMEMNVARMRNQYSERKGEF